MMSNKAPSPWHELANNPDELTRVAPSGISLDGFSLALMVFYPTLQITLWKKGIPNEASQGASFYNYNSIKIALDFYRPHGLIVAGWPAGPLHPKFERDEERGRILFRSDSDEFTIQLSSEMLSICDVRFFKHVR